jgi:PKD repeat protein
MLLIGDWSSGKKELYRYTIPVDSGSSENQPPVASFNYEFPGSNTKNCPTSDDVITFFDNSWDPDDGDTITEWSWDFGDGETSDEQNPSHQYSQSGFYTVNLTVTDGNGAMGSYEEEILVNYPPVVDFTMDIEPPLIAGQIVHFTGTATDQDGTISELEWQVFSGSQPNPEIVSTDINMEYEFTTPDLYVITLMAIDDLGSTGIAGYVLVVNELEETLYFLMAPGIEFDGTTVTFDSASVDEFIGNVFSIDDDTLTIMMNGLTTTLVTDGFTEVNGILQGEVNSISVENAPLVREIADLGEVGASFKANITPENSPDLQDVIIAVSINETASTGVQTAYELAAVDASLDIVDIAYAFNIIGATLENGVDVMDATIVMTASESWVVSQGGPDQVRIFRYSEYDGTTEILEPIYVFDEIAGVYTFTAYSPNGLSVFSLVAVTEIIPDTAPPLISDLLATPNPASINTPVLVTVTVDDSLTGGSAIANVEYTLDGITWFPMTATDGAFDEMTESATVTLPGRASAEIVNILVRTTDAAGNNALSDPLLIAIYDPNGAFVTAGGWILSPEGAYMADATSTGKANLGLNCKYKKGTTIPTGETEFHLKAANLKFKATSYEWLVITGPKAIYRGSGTINENGLYGFQIVAVDGDISGGDDTFWIKIWDKATNALIYDNGAGSTTGEPGTSLGGGNVKIHK